MTNRISDQLAFGSDQIEFISDTPLFDCQILLAFVINQNREWLFAHPEAEIGTIDQERYAQLVAERKAGKPIAYITGVKGFWNHALKVTPSTLIPRPETELIVETILEKFDQSPRTVLDLGTGSGAIAISLAGERHNWNVIGIDQNHEALEVARENARDLPNLAWLNSSWGTACRYKAFDIIVSNPPYIRVDDPHLQELAFEPLAALISGEDGLDAIREIVPDSYDRLKDSGALMVEHGFDQQRAVMDLFHEAGFCNIEPCSDLNGTPRAVFAHKG
jgi:release factor glutamine methyltransferase